MTLDQIVTVIALIAGPTLAVAMTLYFQKREFIRNQRIQLLKTLMAMRAEPVNPERIRALAVIDVVFNDKPSVRVKWKEYYEALNNPVYRTDPNAYQVWFNKQNEMLAEMAKAIGYGGAIGYEELQRMYSPQAYTDNAVMTQEAQKELLRVLKASENFGSAKRAEVVPLKPPTTGRELAP